MGVYEKARSIHDCPKNGSKQRSSYEVYDSYKRAHEEDYKKFLEAFVYNLADVLFK
jgi:hypothetical protein